MKIAILDDYQDSIRRLACFELLDGHDVRIFTSTARGVGQLAIRLAGFEVIVLMHDRTRLSAPLLRRLPALKLIVQAGGANGRVDADAARQCGIAVQEVGGDPVAAAELTWALIMAASRRIVPYAVNLRDGLWQKASAHPDDNPLGMALRSRMLGIWGYGEVGALVAGYGRAFGMRVVVWGTEAERARAALDGHDCAESFAQLFAESDVLSLHGKLDDASCGIVAHDHLAAMKPDALFVNTSHPEFVADGALLEALAAGRPGQAALDVFNTESLAPGAPLLRHPNILATPHIGSVERRPYETLFGEVFRLILDFAGRAPRDQDP